jgi:glyoxylase-like metal-dependent hydrolase (beta-lactamase superfamily II)
MLQVKVLTFNPVQENTYVLYSEENECIIIDPGCYFDHEKDELAGFIKSKNLLPVMLLNTHCHLDHVFGNKFISEQYGLTLQIHPLEEQMLNMAPASGLMYNLPFDNYDGELKFLNEGDVIQLGNNSLEVILTPGHSPGSICFYDRQDLFIIGGDVLFKESIGRTDLPLGNHQQLLTSIRSKLFPLAPEVKVFSGHGPETTIGHEKQHNPFLAQSGSLKL